MMLEPFHLSVYGLRQGLLNDQRSYRHRHFSVVISALTTLQKYAKIREYEEEENAARAFGALCVPRVMKASFWNPNEQESAGIQKY